MTTKTKTTLMIRGDELLLALRIMRLCCGYRERGLSKRATEATFRRLFSDKDKAEEMFCHFANWDGVVRDMLLRLIRASDSMHYAKFDTEVLEEHSPYASESAGIRPVLVLLASHELLEEDFRSKGGA